MSTVMEFSATLNNGNEVALGDYAGKVLLIVNTASKCGFTPQYTGLESLQKTYSANGFSVLAFPCNQFGGQEPGTEQDIESFCDLNYQTTFPLFSKIEVNGASSHPLFTHLKSEAPGVLGSKRIKWNFTKFLINQQGEVVKRYAPSTKPEAIAKDIEALL
ncbi:glutathione peroxidase [Luminiphilus sp.]|jgi:glutathione peroxidase|nr:glutathione peroxidase [Luminiphilus sp.]MDA8986373.1 glutathione peroxidase [Luminiphilus sp.]MDA9941164.1 glutathione peroxidase [Luminiphilus sp.]MDB2643379.1 glutathione peroxidase [Luminiphilus sp.]MDC1116488.1 glutathione peroxidase [Luminiphilus sp.]